MFEACSEKKTNMCKFCPKMRQLCDSGIVSW